MLEYVDAHAQELERLFLEGDGRDPSRYPDFPKLLSSVSSPASGDDLRIVLRFHARRRIEDRRGKEFACGFQEDPQLRAAILELLKKLGRKTEEIPRYAGFAPKS